MTPKAPQMSNESSINTVVLTFSFTLCTVLAITWVTGHSAMVRWAYGSSPPQWSSHVRHEGTQLWLRVPAGSKRVNRPGTCHVWSRARSRGYLRRLSLWIILLEVRGWEANIPGFWLLDTLLGAGAGVTLSQCLLRNSSLSSLIRWLSTRSLAWRTLVQSLYNVPANCNLFGYHHT